jgi:hypothetical protein
MAPRRFPPPWSVETTDACFIVRDRNKQRSAMSISRRNLASGWLQSCSLASRRGALHSAMDNDVGNTEYCVGFSTAINQRSSARGAGKEEEVAQDAKRLTLTYRWRLVRPSPKQQLICWTPAPRSQLWAVGRRPRRGALTSALAFSISGLNSRARPCGLSIGLSTFKRRNTVMTNGELPSGGGGIEMNNPQPFRWQSRPRS